MSHRAWYLKGYLLPALKSVLYLHGDMRWYWDLLQCYSPGGFCPQHASVCGVIVGSSMQLVVVCAVFCRGHCVHINVPAWSIWRSHSFFGSSLLYSRESGATCFDVGLLWVNVSLYKAVMLTRPQGSRSRPRLNNTGVKLKLGGSFQRINKKQMNK